MLIRFELPAVLCKFSFPGKTQTADMVIVNKVRSNATYPASVRADFHYPSFAHTIFSGSFSIGLTFGLTNINAGTAESPALSGKCM